MIRLGHKLKNCPTDIIGLLHLSYYQIKQALTNLLLRSRKLSHTVRYFNFSGTSLNPARSLGPVIITGDFDTNHLVFWVGKYTFGDFMHKVKFNLGTILFYQDHCLEVG